MTTKVIAWDTGTGNITLTYTGQGNGTIIVHSDANNLGSARSKVITVETVGGAITRGFTISQAACPFPVGNVKNFSYTGSYQEIELPPGQYKLQCWGAQGGSNGTNSTYGITAHAGGNGGYSEGILTLSHKTTVRVYVGGQGSSSAGGFNGGGSTTGTSQYNASNEFGYSKMGGGGGATDIRLSDGALFSRMIVAGGGSGGVMCYKVVTTSSTDTKTIQGSSLTSSVGSITSTGKWRTSIGQGALVSVSSYRGYTFTINKGTSRTFYAFLASAPPSVDLSVPNYATGYSNRVSTNTTATGTVPSDAVYLWVDTTVSDTEDRKPSSIVFSKTTSSTTTSTYYQVGYVGGGTNGGGYGSTYYGTQNSAGNSGSFGSGADQTTTTYRYAAGAGGGGWYGGGTSKSNSTTTGIKFMGGGSGWVNTSASAPNRPSGYTGLELDSGTTYAGNTSFPNTAGTGNETGHSGNGYAKITRLS